MPKLPTLPEVGRIVEVTSGRDRGLIAVVVGQEADRFVLIADGSKRPVEKPKKKNVLHVRSTRDLSLEVLEEIQQRGTPTDAKLRYAVSQYLVSREQNSDGSGEGDQLNGER